MSQKTARKGASTDEKEKNQTDSAVKDLKKKMAATAEKDKQATDKPADKKDTTTDKKQYGEQQNGDSDKKGAVKSGDKKPDKAEKNGEKAKVAEKKNEEEKKETANGKGDQKKPDPKQNGHTNGANGSTVSDASDEDCMVIDEEELFPELTYDDNSDTESPTADILRSVTRRSQVKQSRTPETPRPASDKQTDDDNQSHSKETKLLKLKEDPSTTVTNERRLRSTDSPKKTTEKSQETPKKIVEKVPESPKKGTEKVQEPPKKVPEKVQESPKKGTEKVQEVKKTDEKVQEVKNTDDSEKTDKMNEVVILIEDCENSQEGGDSRKPDTNFSKSRVKVSPYRRSGRIADLTASSVMANYTGNNTTMETDMSESSYASPSQSDDRYIAGLRSVRGRSSYRPGAEIAVAEIVRKSAARKQVMATSDPPARPTGTVVGRKRKPDSEEQPEPIPAAAKRPRAFDTLLSPFRRVASSTPLPARRAQPIVGINSDLPMSAPIAASSTFDPASSTFDPESIKPTESSTILPGSTESKRCVVM